MAQLPTTVRGIEQLREAAASCRACDLWEHATQTVFGEGHDRAEIMLIGDQPGEVDDLRGKPFAGPVGRLLDWALEQAGIDRRRVYTTNAVKHFRWVRRGKHKLKVNPNAQQIHACRPWLLAEIEVVRPRTIVLMGAAAALSVMGLAFRVSRQRGKVGRSPFGIPVVATLHPYSILRAIDDASREVAMRTFVSDLRLAARQR